MIIDVVFAQNKVSFSPQSALEMKTGLVLQAKATDDKCKNEKSHERITLIRLDLFSLIV